MDEAVAEIEGAIAQAPAPGRPSRAASDSDHQAYERIADAACDQVLALMRPLVERAPRSLSRAGGLEAAFLGLMKAAALASFASGMAGTDAREMLDQAVAELLGKMSEGGRASLTPRLDA